MQTEFIFAGHQLTLMIFMVQRHPHPGFRAHSEGFGSKFASIWLDYSGRWANVDASAVTPTIKVGVDTKNKADGGG